jgi:hypothetical protein
MAGARGRRFTGGMARIRSRRFDLAPSRRTRAFIAFAHVASAALVGALPLDPLLAGSGALLIVALGARAWRDADGEWAGLVVRSDGSVVGLGNDGRSRPGRLADGSVALPGHVAIAWRAEGERRIRTIGVAGDRLSARDSRDLRVQLRYATSAVEAGMPASQARASTSAPLSALVRPATRCR